MADYKRKCVECRSEFRARQYNADFCCTKCRKDFNNRRATRGAALYDLLMIEAVDPKAFEKQRLDGRVSAMVAAFIAEDAAKQIARSYKRPGDVQADTLVYAR